jgi:hypothetical protein
MVCESQYYDLSPNAKHPGQQLCVASFENGGTFYYLIAIEGGPRDAISFRGISSQFDVTGIQTELLTFHIRGTFLELLTGFSCALDTMTVSGKYTADADPITNHEFQATVHPVAVPFVACDGVSPHGALLRVERQSGPPITITLADFHKGFGLFEVVGFLVVVVIIAHELPMLGSGKGEVDAKVGPNGAKVHGEFETKGGVATTTSGPASK